MENLKTYSEFLNEGQYGSDCFADCMEEYDDELHCSDWCKDTADYDPRLSKNLEIEEQLKQALIKHDWTFKMSDDNRIWNKGEKEVDIIVNLVDQIGPERSKEIFQELADSGKIPPDHSSGKEPWKYYGIDEN